MLVEHDLMQARSEPWAQLFPQPGHRLSVFAEWFARTANEQLLAPSWWERFLERAYRSGTAAGGELVRNSPPVPVARYTAEVPAVYRELAQRELAGIAAALVQQVSRQAGLAGLTRQKPQLMYRQVLSAIRKVGMVRIKAFVNFMTVKLHNAARLEQFRAAGIAAVGIVPERLQRSTPSRFLKRPRAGGDHAIHDQEGLSIEIGGMVEAAQKRWKKRFAELVKLYGEESALVILRQEIEAETGALAATVAEFKKRLAAETAAFVARRKAEGAAVEAARAAREAELQRAFEARQFVNVLTAGDDRVCDICDDIAADGPYSLDEAQGLIPAHPNCRCAFVPARIAIHRELATAAE